MFTNGMIEMLCEQRIKDIKNNTSRFVANVNEIFNTKIPPDSTICDPSLDVEVAYVEDRFIECVILYSHIEKFFVVTISKDSYSLIPRTNYISACKVRDEIVSKW